MTAFRLYEEFSKYLRSLVMIITILHGEWFRWWCKTGWLWISPYSESQAAGELLDSRSGIPVGWKILPQAAAMSCELFFYHRGVIVYCSTCRMPPLLTVVFGYSLSSPSILHRILQSTFLVVVAWERSSYFCPGADDHIKWLCSWRMLLVHSRRCYVCGVPRHVPNCGRRAFPQLRMQCLQVSACFYLPSCP